MANPMYRQIAEDLRAQIESGDLEPGQQLRTELELREKYNASRNTVRDAIKWLTNLGLVETKPGQGTFVTQKIDPFVTTLTGDPRTGAGGDQDVFYLSEVNRHNRKPTIGPIVVEIQEASEEIAAALQISNRFAAEPCAGCRPWRGSPQEPAQYRRRNRELPRQNARHPPSRLSRPDHRTPTEPCRSGLFRATGGRQGLNV